MPPEGLATLLFMTGEDQPLPARYAELTPYDGRGVLQRFIESNWTDNEELREAAQSLLVECHGRYGRWKEGASTEAFSAFEWIQRQEKYEHASRELADCGFRLSD